MDFRLRSILGQAERRCRLQREEGGRVLLDDNQRIGISDSRINIDRQGMKQ